MPKRHLGETSYYRTTVYLIEGENAKSKVCVDKTTKQGKIQVYKKVVSESYLEIQESDFCLLGKEQTAALAFLASTIFSLLNATLNGYSQLLSNFLCS